ncbi:hypothetical protein QJS66_06505 [Kocuria rhizophila]|nr:hypothetical protein QJS66_06505 [Kocuria rhizophila]
MDLMLERGWLDEVRALRARGAESPAGRQGAGVPAAARRAGRAPWRGAGREDTVASPQVAANGSARLPRRSARALDRVLRRAQRHGPRGSAPWRSSVLSRMTRTSATNEGTDEQWAVVNWRACG